MARDLYPCIPRIRVLAKVASLSLSLALCGCAVSFPVGGFVDNTPTGSLKSGPARLSPELDMEDWRRANAALAVALDPQGNGAEATWQNPLSGAHGSFAAEAPPFLEHDRVCRAFKGRVAAGKGAAGKGGGRTLKGSACRTQDGDWVLADVADLARARAKVAAQPQ